MIQSFDTQLQVVLRALREVVMPVLPADNRAVQEQFALSLAALEFMRARLPMSRRYVRADLRAYIDLATAVAATARDDSVGDLARRGQLAFDDPDADDTHLIAVTRALRDAVGDRVEAALGAPYEAELTQLIVTQSAEPLRRERIWCVPLGFELKPDDLGTL
jgi:hypothetical protein